MYPETSCNTLPSFHILFILYIIVAKEQQFLKSTLNNVSIGSCQAR